MYNKYNYYDDRRALILFLYDMFDRSLFSTTSFKNIHNLRQMDMRVIIIYATRKNYGFKKGTFLLTNNFQSMYRKYIVYQNKEIKQSEIRLNQFCNVILLTFEKSCLKFKKFQFETPQNKKFIRYFLNLYNPGVA